MGNSDTNYVDCCRNLVCGRRVEGAIRSLMNGRNLQLESAKVLHEESLVRGLLYDSEALAWREKERSRIRVVQMDSLKGLLFIRRMDNAR